MQTADPLFLIIDLFCGFGGTTTGFAEAELDGNKICKVIACVNHDPKAIRSHWLNHKDVKHFEEDIRTLNLAPLLSLVNYYRAIYPEAKLILWASLECTNFSKAKGGAPRDADSRTLAEHLYRYVAALNPDYIQIENVVEFKAWGPLDENGKPVSRDKGKDWMKWRRHIKKFGYKDDWREINAADLGAYTSRNRLFGCFAKENLPIVWPELTHSKKAIGGLFGGLQKWKPVREVLDFEDEGKSIFNRKKPLSPKTLERIYAGLVKFVAKGDLSFIQKTFSGRPAGKVITVNGPAGTITTAAGQSLVQATPFIQQFNSGFPSSKVISVDGPARTLTATGGNQGIVNPICMLKYNSTDRKGDHYPNGLDTPSPAITTQNRLGVISGEFLAAYYGNGDNVSSVESPCPVIPTKDRFQFVQPEPFIMPTNFDNKPKSLDEPAGTITADRHHSYIVNPSHGGHSTSTDKPCPVIVARQDKAPLYLVQCETGPVQVEIYDTDQEIDIKIKYFMVAYNLIDIKMRMLKIPELLLIQGLVKVGGPDYHMTGTQADMKKFIGNSVHPTVPKNWAEAQGRPLMEVHKAA